MIYRSLAIEIIFFHKKNIYNIKKPLKLNFFLDEPDNHQ
jgi:hypothetical protein